MDPHPILNTRKQAKNYLSDLEDPDFPRPSAIESIMCPELVSILSKLEGLDKLRLLYNKFPKHLEERLSKLTTPILQVYAAESQPGWSNTWFSNLLSIP